MINLFRLVMALQDFKENTLWMDSIQNERVFDA